MSSWLDYEPGWQPIMDKLDPGETVRINHTKCEAGEDARKRLYLTRPATGGGTVLGYCHNCQKGGSFKAEGGTFRVPSVTDELAESYSEDKFGVPTLDTDVSTWPADARHWLYQYSLHNSTFQDYGIAYIPSLHRMYIPIWSEYSPAGGTTYKGYQTRRLWSHGKTTKYSTHLRNKHTSMDTILYNGDTPEFSIIVEDTLSGLRILQWAGYSSTSLEVLINYGTKINVEAMAKLRGENVSVWLDNDNSHVVDQARKIARTASLVLKKPVTTILHKSDPKKYDYEDIREAIYGHR